MPSGNKQPWPDKARKARRVEKNKPTRIPKKVIFRQQIIEYISDPAHAFPTRGEMAKHVGTSFGNLYKHFDLDEFSEMELEGFELRRKRSLRNVSQVYDAMEEAATGYSHDDVHISNYKGDIYSTDIKKYYPPNPHAASVLLDRLQGKVKQVSEHTGAGGERLFPKFLPINGIDLSDVTDEELVLLEKIGAKLEKTEEEKINNGV